MTEAQRSLLTIGETLVLLAAPEPGPLRHAHELRLGVGGAESNVAIGVSRLGGRATWVGRVGDDEFGKLILRTLRAEGVDVSGAVVDAGAATSLMLKERRTSDRARVTYYRSDGPGARLEPRDVPSAVVAAAGVLHVTGITLALSRSAYDTVFATVRAARAAGVPVSLDVNHRASLWSAADAREAIEAILPSVDHCFIGHREAAYLGYDGEPAEIGRRLGALGPETVIVKLGARGAVAVEDGVLHEVAPAVVSAIDPVGAGDAFAAGYLAELLEDRPIGERLRTAATCGAYAVTSLGDWESLPERDDLRLLADEPDRVLR